MCLFTAATILFEDGLTGLGLAEWDLSESDTNSAPHKMLRDVLHAAGESGVAAAAAFSDASEEQETLQEVSRLSNAPPTEGASSPMRRLDVATSMTTSIQPLHFLPSNQVPSFWHNAPIVQPQTRQRFPQFPPYVMW